MVRGALLFVFISLAGCTSVSSTLLNRTDSDVFYGNSNGKPHCQGQARPFTGIPITVRVPTHVDVAIREKIRFKIGDDTLEPLTTCKRHLFVETAVIHTEKVFTVDIKRPAAGTLDYEVDFGDEEASKQYFDSIKSKIVDETIADTTAAITGVISAFRTSNDGQASTNDDLVIDETRTVAWKRFDLDSPDFEMAVSEFVDRHLNCCHSCQEYRAVDSGVIELNLCPIDASKNSTTENFTGN